MGIILHFYLTLLCVFFHTRLVLAATALITGITGQDGSYMAEFLLDKGYTVHGIVRRSSTPNTANIEHLIHDRKLEGKLILHYADLTDDSSIRRVLEIANPDEIYNLGGQTDVRISFDTPVQTGDITGMGVVRLLEANRQFGGKAKVYQASTSELYGIASTPQSESTPFHPRSPYGVAKLYGYWIGVNYRESYGMFVSNGILFNHESPRRGENFITRKITKALAQILKGDQDVLELGNMDSKRDWGFAPDYVECMWKMMQMEKPGDYVVGTGEQHSVREFVERAFDYAGITLEWCGQGTAEKGVVKAVVDRWKGRLGIGQTLIRINPQFFRPAEVHSLLADPRKALSELDWKPKIAFSELIKIMVDADLQQAGLEPIGEGMTLLNEKYPYTAY